MGVFSDVWGVLMMFESVGMLERVFTDDVG